VIVRNAALRQGAVQACRALLLCALTLAHIVPSEASSAPAPTVASVDVTGNSHISSGRILAVVSTKAGDPFDPAKINDDLRAIADLGYFADQKSPLIQARNGGVEITFRVIENPVVASIRFTGNNNVSAETLLALMDTAPGQVFNTKTNRADVLKINSYYDKMGFGGQLASHVVDVNIGGDGRLVIALQEGLTVRSVLFTAAPERADPVLPPSLLESALITKRGSLYSDAERDKDYDALEKLYEAHDLKIGDIEGGIDPTTIDTKAGTADVRYTITVLRVGAVEITGNTKTHDDVIRRELRLRPGMLVTEAALRNDYERLNNLGYFDKIDFESKPGPDPNRPALITINWIVKEERTGNATVGAGYSGGATGTGLSGNLSLTENDINGTGDGVALKLERGTQVKDAQFTFTIPRLGSTARSQKYSLTASLYTQEQVNAYAVYYATPAPSSAGSTAASSQGIPVTLIPADSSSDTAVSGAYADYHTRSTGVSATLGRRLNDVLQVQTGVNAQRVYASATAPNGYYFASSAAVNQLTTTASGLTGSTSVSTALGVTAPSIATIDSTKTYELNSILIGLSADSRDDVRNPRRGTNASIGDEISSTAFGSRLNYSIVTLDAARFFPVGRDATFGIHARAGATTGAIPSTKLFTFSDQDLRGYSTVFYGTDMLLGQAELRIPLTADRKFSIVTFGDIGAMRVRGGTSVVDNGNGSVTTYDLNRFTPRGDLGVGIRFDIPQLGLRTLRLDFAKGRQGTHTSFGIGQSF
jgi:outer membrane protein assembly factor BamA